MILSTLHRKLSVTAFFAAILTLWLMPSTPGRANPSVLVDVDTGAVLSSEEATRPWHPASTAKLMTVYLALKAVRDGKLTLDTPLAGTRRAAAQRPSKIGIRPGQIITLDNALKILLVKSANDLAYVIGEAIGGDAEHFVALMNGEAQRLGMRETVFTNPNGWHDPRMQVSARDLALLALALYREFPEYRDYWGIGSVQLGARVYKNTNGLIGRYSGALGMKTGFVCASGFNVVALANRNGRTLLAVVLGAGSGAERTIQAARLFDSGFASYRSSGSGLLQLPSSGYDSAPDVKADVCGRHRRGPLTEEDFDGAISAATSFSNSTDKDSIYATIREQYGDSNSGGRVSRNSSLLEERSLGVPVAVYLGRAPGNTEPVYNAASFAVAGRGKAGPDYAFDTTVAPKGGKFNLSAEPKNPDPKSDAQALIEPEAVAPKARTSAFRSLAKTKALARTKTPAKTKAGKTKAVAKTNAVAATKANDKTRTSAKSASAKSAPVKAALTAPAAGKAQPQKAAAKAAPKQATP